MLLTQGRWTGQDLENAGALEDARIWISDILGSAFMIRHEAL
jgi:hypothetical protein